MQQHAASPFSFHPHISGLLSHVVNQNTLSRSEGSKPSRKKKEKAKR
jgi:hypothetical protein